MLWRETECRNCENQNRHVGLNWGSGRDAENLGVQMRVTHSCDLAVWNWCAYSTGVALTTAAQYHLPTANCIFYLLICTGVTTYRPQWKFQIRAKGNLCGPKMEAAVRGRRKSRNYELRVFSVCQVMWGRWSQLQCHGLHFRYSLNGMELNLSVLIYRMSKKCYLQLVFLSRRDAIFFFQQKCINILDLTAAFVFTPLFYLATVTFYQTRRRNISVHMAAHSNVTAACLSKSYTSVSSDENLLSNRGFAILCRDNYEKSLRFLCFL